jgi:GTP-binding protein
VLIHVIDMAAVDQRDPWEDYVRINEELVQYRPELAQRPQIIALNKSDLPDSEVFIDAYLARFRAEKRPVFVISAGARTGLEPLLKGVVQLLQDQPRLIDSQPREEVLQWPVDELNERVFYVEAERNGFRVRGRRIERLVSMTNFAQSESLGRLQRVLEATGITAELLRQGIEVGQTVYIEKAALTWTEDYVP